MASFFDLFRRGRDTSSVQDEIIDGLDKVSESNKSDGMITEQIKVQEDNRQGGIISGQIDSITESKTSYSPDNLSKMLSSDSLSTDQLLSGLRSDFNLNETFQENEEMSRDSVIGSAMEIIADDACQRDERTNHVVDIESDDESLQRFLQDFLTNNVNIEDRIWGWTFEVVKHGDLKLRRREYYAGSEKSGIRNVYYEDVINPYLVSRIEYMGNVIGFEDEDIDTDDRVGSGYSGAFSGSAKFERSEEFVHFMSSKMSKRYKVKLSVRDSEGKLENIVCYKVVGTSIVDNVRYIYRIINMLDNMLVLSRIARSTQYNLVKVEVGNASPGKTQQILMDIRRRIEGSTKLKKNTGMKTDPSPIPINSNVYLPTREGKGDVTIESVGDNVDVRSIVDIDYFRDKEFAALKIPKAYMGFEEALGGSLGNNSLAKMDIRYARSVQRVQSILVNGIRNLCNNYLIYRGRHGDVNKFKVRMRPVVTSETAGRVEEFMTNMQAFDSMSNFLTEYGPYVDKAKVLKSMLGLVGWSPSDIASEEFSTILQEMEEGKYKEENHKIETPEGDDSRGGW